MVSAARPLPLLGLLLVATAVLATAHLPVAAADGVAEPLVIEGEALVRGARATQGTVKLESMRDHGEGWSGWAQLRWRPYEAGQSLKLVVVAPEDGLYGVEVALTHAPDAADVQWHADGRALGEPLAAWAARVEPGGLTRLGEVALRRGANDLVVRTIARDPRSRGWHVGLDRMVLTPLGGGARASGEAPDPYGPPGGDGDGAPAAFGPPATPAGPEIAVPDDVPADEAMPQAPLPAGPLPEDLPAPSVRVERPAPAVEPEPAVPAQPAPGQPLPAEAAPVQPDPVAEAPLRDPDAEVPAFPPPAGAANERPTVAPPGTKPPGTEPPAAPTVLPPEVVPQAPPSVAPAAPPREPSVPSTPGPAEVTQPAEVPAPPATAPSAAAEPTPDPARELPPESERPELPVMPEGPTPADRRLLFEAVTGLERFLVERPRGAEWATALRLGRVRAAMAAQPPDDEAARALARRLGAFPAGPAYKALLAEPAFVRLARALEVFVAADDWSTPDR